MAYVASDRPIAVEIDPGIRWSAIFGGWLVATGIAGLLYIGGLALGFSAFDAQEAGGNLKGIGIGTLVWTALTWIVALLLGGMFASWLDGRTDETVGSLHGVTVWGLSITSTAVFLALGVGHAIHGMRGPGPDMRPMAAGAAAAPAVAVLHARIEHMLGPDGGRGGMRAHGGDADPIVAALLTRNDRTANDLLEASSNLPAGEASAALQRLTPQIEAARTQAAQAADAAAHRAAMLAWSAFASALLGLIAAAIGGWLGARNIRRVHHLREYPPVVGRRLP